MKNENNNRTSVPSTDVESGFSYESLAKEEAEGLDSRVNIRVISYRKRVHDPEGISVKAVLDGLVQRGILLDDSTKEINEVTFKSIICEKGQAEKTVIEITDSVPYGLKSYEQIK